MQQATTTSYPVSDFSEWYRSDQLELAPKFQRRGVWEAKAKSYLIDTIARAMPIPPLFIRLRLDTKTQRSIREVVDGQQRLRAVLAYLDDDFPIMKAHNKELAGKHFSELSEEHQRMIRRYKFSVTTLEDVTDADVLAIFARLNTYTVRLNAQELRNAEFFGQFKQMVYALGLEHYAFWLGMGILSDQQVARMDEAELVSELLVTMIDGIRQTKAADLRDFYERYDDSFPRQDELAEAFRATIDLCGEVLDDDELRSSFFTRKPVFYSLFTALYDARFGLPKSNRSRLNLTKTQMADIRRRLKYVQGRVAEEEPPSAFKTFRENARFATADVGRRRARHAFLWSHVLDKVA